MVASNPCCPRPLTGEAARARAGSVPAGGAGPPARQRASAAPVCSTGQRHRALDPEQDGGKLVPFRELFTALKLVPELTRSGTSHAAASGRPLGFCSLWATVHSKGGALKGDEAGLAAIHSFCH